MRSIVVGIGMLCLLLASMVLAQESDEARSEVIDFVKNYINANNEYDATAMMDMISRNPNVSSVAVGKITRGWEAIRAQVDENLAEGGAFGIKIGVMDVFILGNANAMAVAPFHAKVDMEGTDISISGAMTFVLEKSNGKWKIIHEHGSIDWEKMFEAILGGE